MSFSLAKTKFLSIKTRSFKSFLDLFLICTYISDKSLLSANIENFKVFNYNDSRISKALGVYQLAKNTDNFCDTPVSALDKVIEMWHKANNLAPFRNIFEQEKIIDESGFKLFFGEDQQERKCFYCKITETEIQSLFEAGKLSTKRLSTRGFKMEIDRLSPNKGYVQGNIALCCYWCNNAKTDEFTAEEFEPIGKLIGQTLKNRLNK